MRRRDYNAGTRRYDNCQDVFNRQRRERDQQRRQVSRASAAPSSSVSSAPPSSQIIPPSPSLSALIRACASQGSALRPSAQPEIPRIQLGTPIFSSPAQPSPLQQSQSQPLQASPSQPSAEIEYRGNDSPHIAAARREQKSLSRAHRAQSRAGPDPDAVPTVESLRARRKAHVPPLDLEEGADNVVFGANHPGGSLGNLDSFRCSICHILRAWNRRIFAEIEHYGFICTWCDRHITGKDLNTELRWCASQDHELPRSSFLVAGFDEEQDDDPEEDDVCRDCSGNLLGDAHG